MKRKLDKGHLKEIASWLVYALIILSFIALAAVAVVLVPYLLSFAVTYIFGEEIRSFILRWGIGAGVLVAIRIITLATSSVFDMFDWLFPKASSKEREKKC